MIANKIFQHPRLHWMQNADIRPYVFVRPENRIHNPGGLHSSVDWFPHEVIYKNPLEMKEVHFANRIMSLEAKAFGPSNMAMPRWVFYDCAIVPGFVAGFAARVSSLPKAVIKELDMDAKSLAQDEWMPLSLFIIIPTMSDKGEWVAHNLCSVNSVLSKEHQYYGIGFISKAFGLWYANVRTCCGMTQWMSPSIKLHSNYGDFEILTSYTPVHSYARTLTYRLNVEPSRWEGFFSKKPSLDFQKRHTRTDLQIDPKSEESLIDIQSRLELGQGPFFLDSQETLSKSLEEPLQLYLRK